MKADAILQSDLLDIIFENKNKQYGAYVLRKQYNHRLTIALMAMFAIVVITALLISREHKKKILDIPEIMKTFVMSPAVPEKPKLPEPVKPKAIPATAQKKNNTVQFNTQIKIVDNNIVTTKLPDLTDSSAIAGVTFKGPGDDNPIVTIPGGVPAPPGKVPSTTMGTTDPTTPRVTAEIMPSYPGGIEALRAFLARHLTNPEDVAAGEEVNVKVRFVVGIDGRLKGFEVTEDGGNAFNNEVIRVLKKMPEWVPGRSQGQNVSVYYTVPVKFVSAE